MRCVCCIQHGLQYMLSHLRGVQIANELRESRRHHASFLQRLPVIIPDSNWRMRWDMAVAVVLLFTCIVEPLRIAFPTVDAGHESTWRILEVRPNVHAARQADA